MFLIAVDSSKGIIGVGKSTLVENLAAAIPGAKGFYEPVETDYLEYMYDEMARGIRPSPAAFTFQMRLLGLRHQVCQQAWDYVLHERKVAIVDRFLPSDTGFEMTMYKDGMLDDFAHRAYNLQFDCMSRYIHAPTLLIDIQASESTCINRIKARMSKDTERESECAVTIDYLQRLSTNFQETVLPWYRQRATPILTLDWEEYQDIDNLISTVKEKLPLHIQAAVPIPV